MVLQKDFKRPSLPEALDGVDLSKNLIIPFHLFFSLCLQSNLVQSQILGLLKLPTRTPMETAWSEVVAVFKSLKQTSEK